MRIRLTLFLIITLCGALSVARDFVTFKVVTSKGEPVDAQVVIIGNTHDGFHYLQATSIINKLGANGDIVLVEGAWLKDGISADHIVVASRFPGLLKSYLFGGWDNELLNKAALFNFKMAQDNLSPFPEKIAILKAIAHLRAFHQIGIVERNKSMAKAILDNVTKGKVFVITGTQHTFDEGLLRFLESSGLKYLVLANLESPERQSSTKEIIDKLSAQLVEMGLPKKKVESTVDQALAAYMKPLNDEIGKSSRPTVTPQQVNSSMGFMRNCSQLFAKFHLNN